MNHNNKINIFLVALFSLVLILSLLSSINDSATSDESPHIIAGYSYLSQKDMRLNPEHPPLVKDLAAIPLLFLKINFPNNSFAWEQSDGPFWWHQFNLGGEFLYHSGNDPDKILFFARIPMVLILILCGYFLFKFAKEFFGEKIALLALFFFAFSPTFLAHGRLVTTDVGAAFGVIFACLFSLRL